MSEINDELQMTNRNIFWIACLFILVATGVGKGQQKIAFDLQKLLAENKLVTFDHKVIPIQDGNKRGVSCNAIIWLKDVSFSNGTIEVDLRGKDIQGRSFLGIAFHGEDTITYDAVYFRPFNFQATDPIKQIHAVQYIGHPLYTWKKLREERNGEYEKGIHPPPLPGAWFHARIEVKDGEVAVFVNNATISSLRVKTLTSRQDGLVGLWNFDLYGDFANLMITNK